MGDMAEMELEQALMASLCEDRIPRRRRLTPRIADHTDKELDIAIATAVDKIPGFWKILHGVDAYMERRNRRNRPNRLNAIQLSAAALDEEIE